MTDLPILEELRASIGAAALRDERPPARRRWSLRPALAAALAAPALALLLVVAPQDGAPPADFTGADPGDRIVHLVYETRGSGRRPGARAERTETWLSADGCRGRTRITRSGGRLFMEVAETPAEGLRYLGGQGRMIVWRRDARSGYEIRDLVADFRARRTAGDFRPAGRETRGGRTLARFVRRERRATETWLVDPQTDVPVEMRRALGRQAGVFRATFLTYEHLPADPKLLTMTPRPHARVERLRTPGPTPWLSDDLRRPECHPGGR